MGCIFSVLSERPARQPHPQHVIVRPLPDAAIRCRCPQVLMPLFPTLKSIVMVQCDLQSIDRKRVGTGTAAAFVSGPDARHCWCNAVASFSWVWHWVKACPVAGVVALSPLRMGFGSRPCALSRLARNRGLISTLLEPSLLCNSDKSAALLSSH